MTRTGPANRRTPASGPRPHRRVARRGGAVYVDLATAAPEAVEIAPTGWRVVAEPPVKFVRGPYAGPLPRPEPGGSVDDLREHVNLGDPEFILYVGAVLD